MAQEHIVLLPRASCGASMPTNFVRHSLCRRSPQTGTRVRHLNCLMLQLWLHVLLRTRHLSPLQLLLLLLCWVVLHLLWMHHLLLLVVSLLLVHIDLRRVALYSERDLMVFPR